MTIFESNGETIDLSKLGLDDLASLLQKVNEEFYRQSTIQNAQTTIEEINKQVLMDRDGDEETPEFILPTAAHDAYPVDYKVVHQDKQWINLTPANTYPPPIGWREIGVDAPEWVQPTGAHDAYRKGERVRYDGEVYVSLVNNNAHSPHDYPAGWEREVEEPEVPEEPTIQTWSPTARYEVGNRVTYNGRLYQCLVAHGAEYQGTWKPGVAHSVWKDLGPVA